MMMVQYFVTPSVFTTRTLANSRAANAGHIKAGRSDVNFGEFDIAGVVPRVLPWMPILHFTTRDCRLMNCSKMPQTEIQETRRGPEIHGS